MKRAKGPEDGNDQNSKAKQAKIRCEVKPIFPMKVVRATNIESSESLEDDDHNNYKEQHSKTNTKEFFMAKDRLNATSKKFEMEEADEIGVSTAEHSLHSKIPSQVSVYPGSNIASSVTSEGSSEDVPCERIHVPHSTSPDPNDANSQNTLNPKIFIEHKLDYNELATNSITSDTTSDSRNRQDKSYFATEDLGLSLIQPLPFQFPSPETNNSNITNSAITSQINNISDIFHGQQVEVEISLEQFSNSFHINLEENTDLEEINNDMNAFEIILEEMENERFQTGSSTTEETVTKKCASELVSRSSNTNHLQDNATTSNTIAETESNDSESSINNKEKIKRGNSLFADSNLKRCGHSKTNSDLLIIKNSRSQLKMKTQKYSVISKNRIKNSINELCQKTNIQTFIKNTMKDTHPDLSFKGAIGMGLEIFLWDLLHRIGDEAENLVTLSSKKVLDKRVLKYAIKFTLEKMKNEADVVSGKRNQWLF